MQSSGLKKNTMIIRSRIKRKKFETFDLYHVYRDLIVITEKKNYSKLFFFQSDKLLDSSIVFIFDFFLLIIIPR